MPEEGAQPLGASGASSASHLRWIALFGAALARYFAIVP